MIICFSGPSRYTTACTVSSPRTSSVHNTQRQSAPVWVSGSSVADRRASAESSAACPGCAAAAAAAAGFTVGAAAAAAAGGLLLVRYD